MHFLVVAVAEEVVDAAFVAVVAEEEDVVQSCPKSHCGLEELRHHYQQDIHCLANRRRHHHHWEEGFGDQRGCLKEDPIAHYWFHWEMALHYQRYPNDRPTRWNEQIASTTDEKVEPWVVVAAVAVQVFYESPRRRHHHRHRLQG